jgi:hypothetical protein
MRDLIVVLRDLLQKVKDGTADYMDWMVAARAVLDVLIDSQRGFGEPDPGEQEEVRGLVAELIEEADGEPQGGMQAGPLVTVLLPILIKFLLSKAFDGGSDDQLA